LIIPPEFRERHEQGIVHYLATGEGPVLNKRIELEALRADGSRFPAELTVTVAQVEDKAYFTAYLRDITERKRAEEDLRESNEEMQRFAYIVSHDLRAPLVNIMGFTSELEALRDDAFARLRALEAAPAAQEAAQGGAGRTETLAQDFDEALGFIKASIAKMDRLINAILRLSREGRRAFNPETVDMTALIGGIAKSLAHQAEAAGATIAIAEALPPVTSDRLALEQIFSNLIDNALKYLRPGEPGQVTVTGRAAGSRIIYEVRDNGRGIEERDRERVFELFRRAGAQDRPGEGIGLAHVRALVRRLGGKIRLDSEPGLGSTFTVVLPTSWSAEAEKKAA
jgi:signal transduction histidine kinase